MKAKIILLGLCALGLAACSVDETKQVNDANSITFKATVPYATRAAATTANSLGSFSVWAWTGDDTEKTTFMNHVTAVNNGSGTYTTSPLYFWPTTSVDFLGVSPAVDGTDGEYVYIGGKYDSPELGDDEGNDSYYTGHVGKITFDEDNCGKILVDVPSSYENQIDLCYAVATEQTSGSVLMNFRHALTQVVFEARTSNPEMAVDIAGVKICSLYKTGEYTLPSASTATNLDEDDLGTAGISDSQGSWTVGTAYSKSSFSAGLTDDVVTVPTDGTSATLTASDGALFLIPQEVAAWDVLTDHHLTNIGAYFRINCKVTDNGAQIWPNSTEADTSGIPDYAEVAVPVEVAWDEGYKYTYTFVFGDGLGYYPPDDPNDPESSDTEATPVLVPISFTVSVDEFQATDEVEVSTQTESITVHSATDLKAAIAAGYDEVVIAEDITLENEYLWIENDCTIVLEEDATLYTSAEYSGYTMPAFYVVSGTLTIEGEGTVAFDPNVNDDYAPDGVNNGYYGVWTAGGNVVINGGNFISADHAVYCHTGFAYIYGGNFSCTQPAANGEYMVLNCKDANYKNGTANIYVYGGSYGNSFDPSNNLSEGSVTNFVVDGYVSTKSGSTDSDGFYWYTVTEAN